MVTVSSMTMTSGAYQTVASLSVPAGVYVATVTASLFNQATSAAPVSCVLQLGNNTGPGYPESLSPFVSGQTQTSATQSITRADLLTAASTISYRCIDNTVSGSIQLFGVSLIATKVGALHT